MMFLYKLTPLPVTKDIHVHIPHPSQSGKGGTSNLDVVYNLCISRLRYRSLGLSG